MRVEQLMNMVMRMFVRRGISKGMDMGFKAMSKQGKGRKSAPMAAPRPQEQMAQSFDIEPGGSGGQAQPWGAPAQGSAPQQKKKNQVSPEVQEIRRKRREKRAAEAAKRLNGGS